MQSKILSLLLMALSGCVNIPKPEPDPLANLPKLEVLWSDRTINNGDLPVLGGGFLIGAIQNQDFTVSLYRQAYDLTQKQPAWKYPRVMQGQHAAYTQGHFFISDEKVLRILDTQGQEIWSDPPNLDYLSKTASVSSA